MVIVKLLLACAIGIIVANAADTSQSCEIPLNHYTELGCTPVNSEGKCPLRYECPRVGIARSQKTCYYKSKAYRIGEKIDDEENDSVCSVQCVCREFDKGASFLCAAIDCPENFGRWSLPEAERCVYQYRMKDCCSYKQVCDKAEKAALKTCKVFGKTYMEGERIYPDEGCQSCICDESFSGNVSSLNCQKTNCGTEIHHGDDAMTGCAPVYFERRPCCPIQWKCPEDTDTFEVHSSPSESSHESTFSASSSASSSSASSVASASSGSSNEDVDASDKAMQCKYGDKMLNVGDVVKAEGCITCTCQVPPLMGCTKAANC